jgi:hypothetical protein
VAFVRAKKRGDRTYHYLVESFRTSQGKVRHRTVAYLGEYATVDQALAELPLDIEECRDYLCWLQSKGGETTYSTHQLGFLSARLAKLRCLMNGTTADSAHKLPASDTFVGTTKQRWRWWRDEPMPSSEEV